MGHTQAVCKTTHGMPERTSISIYICSVCLCVYICTQTYTGSPGGSVVKNPPASEGDTGLTPGWNALEKEMATHSSILAWEIPWTEEPGRLPSIGLKRVGHD